MVVTFRSHVDPAAVDVETVRFFAQGPCECTESGLRRLPEEKPEGCMRGSTFVPKTFDSG